MLSPWLQKSTPMAYEFFIIAVDSLTILFFALLASWGTLQITSLKGAGWGRGGGTVKTHYFTFAYPEGKKDHSYVGVIGLFLKF
jgi:hypothetical protein